MNGHRQSVSMSLGQVMVALIALFSLVAIVIVGVAGLWHLIKWAF